MTLPPNPVHWFEIPVMDMHRAVKFYEEVFGFSLDVLDMEANRWAFFPMEDEATGAGGALIQHDAITPSHQGTTVYFRVVDINPVLERIEKAGGKTLLPRSSVAIYGYIAHFEDSEGNRVALHEPLKG